MSGPRSGPRRRDSVRASELFGQTLREAPSDAEVPSHRLLVRGAFIRRVAAGVYAWLPLGLRVLHNVARIVREEMDAHGAVELLMPGLLPRELLDRSGRWDTFGPELYRLRDLSDREWYLGPTHEEVFTALATSELASYRDLPKIVYQIGWKFRDAPRPRGGLLRAREFLMKDAYSFDSDAEGLEASYARMVDAYRRTFERCALTVRMVEAHPGVMGGTRNHEFMHPSPSGEGGFVSCSGCDYAASVEAAASRPADGYDFGEAPPTPVKVHTPDLVTVADVARFLDVEPRQLVKSLLYRTSDGVVCALVGGDRELNENKLRDALGGAAVEMVSDDVFAERGWSKGYSGPVGLEGVRVIADTTLRDGRNLVTGANEPDHHLTGVVPGRDFEPDAWSDLITAVDGDRCVRCDATLVLERGIEVGHVFQLGTKYSALMDAAVTDASGASSPLHMGCYGLGVSRTLAAIVEEHHDDRGIAWPRAVAPFAVVILAIGTDERVRAAATELYKGLAASGVDVLFDDRDVSPGVRFADADLIGYPLQVVVGKTFAATGQVELKVRATGETSSVDPTVDGVLAGLEGCP